MIFGFIGRVVAGLGFLVFIAVAVSWIFAGSELTYAKEVKNLNSAFSDNASLSIIVDKEKSGDDKRLAVLNRGWTFAFADEQKYTIVPVSERYVTDFASVPPWLHWLVPPFGAHTEAAIVHDWLYAIGGDAKDRQRADEIFYIAMRKSGVADWRARLMFTGVRIGGSHAFGRDNEWSRRFYDPVAKSLLVSSCIIERPDRGTFIQNKSADLVREDVLYRGDRRYTEQWQEVFGRDVCVEQLLVKTSKIFGSAIIVDGGEGSDAGVIGAPTERVSLSLESYLQERLDASNHLTECGLLDRVNQLNETQKDYCFGEAFNAYFQARE